jgi:hypothetical protein
MVVVASDADSAALIAAVGCEGAIRLFGANWHASMRDAVAAVAAETIAVHATFDAAVLCCVAALRRSGRAVLVDDTLDAGARRPIAVQRSEAAVEVARAMQRIVALADC